MKEPFPSLKEIWQRRADPDLVAKFMGLFSGIDLLLIVAVLALGKAATVLLITACIVGYLLTSLLTLYLYILSKCTWRTYLWWIPFKAVTISMMFYLYR